MKINKLKLIELIDKKAKITFEAEPCNIPIKGNCSAIDEETDKKTEDWISAGLTFGDLNRWFTAKVTARYKTWEYSDYLGGCSYNSFADFTDEIDGYYTDMVKQAKAGLVNYILLERLFKD